MKHIHTFLSWLRTFLLCCMVCMCTAVCSSQVAQAQFQYGPGSYNPKFGRLKTVKDEHPNYQPIATQDRNLIHSSEPFLMISDYESSQNVELYFGEDFSRFIQFDKIANHFEFSDSVFVMGSIRAETNIIANNFLYLNADDTGHAIIRFGNALNDELFGFDATNNYFVLTDDLRVQGDMHSDTATIDGVMNIRGVPYMFDNEVGSTGEVLALTSSGELMWTTHDMTTNMNISPNFPNAVFQGDGSNNIGQLKLDRDNNNRYNHYTWNTSAGTLQDYTIAVEVTLPENFTAWDTVPFVINYKTSTASTNDNKVNVRILDANGIVDGVLNDLTNADWATAQISSLTRPYSAGDTITLLIDVFATNGNPVDIGRITLDYT